jgi:hypothetical protein
MAGQITRDEERRERGTAMAFIRSSRDHGVKRIS